MVKTYASSEAADTINKRRLRKKLRSLVCGPLTTSPSSGRKLTINVHCPDFEIELGMSSHRHGEERGDLGVRIGEEDSAVDTWNGGGGPGGVARGRNTFGTEAGFCSGSIKVYVVVVDTPPAENLNQQIWF